MIEFIFPPLLHSSFYLTSGHNEYFVHLEQVINLPNIYDKLLKEIVRYDDDDDVICDDDDNNNYLFTTSKAA